MVHRKSIPVQSLLYCNNFLEFSYFFSGYNFKYIYIYSQILMLFIQKLFVNLFGFSINQIKIDYFKDNVDIYIDFRNVSYFIKSGFIYKKLFNLSFGRSGFLYKLVKVSYSLYNKWLDFFVCNMLYLYKIKDFFSYRRILHNVLMLKKYKISELAKNKKFFIVDVCIYNLFVYMFWILFYIFDILFKDYLYFFYGFFIYFFSFVYGRCLMFDSKLVVVNPNFLEIPEKTLISDQGDIAVLDILDFIRLYKKSYIKLINKKKILTFFYLYLKRFFLFLFYNIIFRGDYCNFCFSLLNYFNYIFFCWKNFRLYLFIFSFNKKYLFVNEHSILYTFNIVQGLYNFKFNMCSFGKNKFLYVFKKEYIYIFRKFQKFNKIRENPQICFKFMRDSIEVFFFKFNLFFCVFFFEITKLFFISKCRFLKLKGIKGAFPYVNIWKVRNKLLRTYSRKKVDMNEMWYLNCAWFSSSAFFKKLSFFEYKMTLHRYVVPYLSLRRSYRQLKYECLRTRGIFVGFRFKRFFEKKLLSINLYHRYQYLGFKYNSKSILYFLLYFLFQIEFIFKLLLNYKYVDLFYFYIVFLFKNWYFLYKIFNVFFNKYSFCKKVNIKRIKVKTVMFQYFYGSVKYNYFFYKFAGRFFKTMIISLSNKKLNFLFSFYTYGFMKYRLYNLNRFSFLFIVKIDKIKVFFRFFKYHFFHVCCFRKNFVYMYKHFIPKCFLFNLFFFSSGLLRNLIFPCFNVINFNCGIVVLKLLNKLLSTMEFCLDFDVYMFSFFFFSKLGVQMFLNFSHIFVYSFLVEFNLNFFKGLSILFCFFHFGIDFYFKFYFNLYFVNFLYFCEFFNCIFSLNLLLNFIFLKIHLLDYRFRGFLGLYLLIFKMSKNYINITGFYILNYIYDIFCYLFITNRYKRIWYILKILSQMFNEFLDLRFFCGFNFRIKGRLSKKTQRKRCFVLNRGVLQVTNNTRNLFQGNRILNTHIGSVSIYLAIRLKID